MQNRLFLSILMLIISTLSLKAQTNDADKVRKNELSINMLPIATLLINNGSSSGNFIGENFAIYRHFYTRNALRIGFTGYSNDYNDASKRYFVIQDSSFTIHNSNVIEGYASLFAGWERHSKAFDLNKVDLYYGADVFAKVGDRKTYDMVEKYAGNSNGVYQLVPSSAGTDYQPSQKTVFYEVGLSPLLGLRVPVKKRSVFGFEAAMNFGLLNENNTALNTKKTSFDAASKFRITYGVRF